MLTRVAPWIAMTNAVSAAAICAHAEVPASSMSDARSARSGKSLLDAVLLQYLWVPFLAIGWELCEATDIDALATVRRVRRSGRARTPSRGVTRTTNYNGVLHLRLINPRDKNFIS